MKRILVIEDNEQNMYLMTFILENEGHRVIQAQDGHSGIELALEKKPDLILLDIQLPEIDGYAVAKKLKGHSGAAHIPIVAVTSYAMVGDKERVMEAGCNGYIEKPINPDTFMTSIKPFFSSRPETKGGAS